MTATMSDAATNAIADVIVQHVAVELSAMIEAEVARQLKEVRDATHRDD